MRVKCVQRTSSVAWLSRGKSLDAIHPHEHWPVLGQYRPVPVADIGPGVEFVMGDGVTKATPAGVALVGCIIARGTSAMIGCLNCQCYIVLPSIKSLALERFIQRSVRSRSLDKEWRVSPVMNGIVSIRRAFGIKRSDSFASPSQPKVDYVVAVCATTNHHC